MVKSETSIMLHVNYPTVKKKKLAVAWHRGKWKDAQLKGINYINISIKLL